MTLRAGTYLQDRYEILEQIGSGGMSVVYKAKCHKLNRQVAIKVLKEEFSSDSNFVSKFNMEAQAAAGLSHPNIVSVYDVIDEGKLHYIVMELIEGITLKSYIAKKGRLEVKETIGIAIQVAQGIAAAHEQHIIHRDIKPQNMIISKDGKVKVADFGIARAVSAQTLSSAAMGSVHYISPEQARGGYSDERSDLYSLGITMYEMATGRVPFEGENTVSIALAHLNDALIPPSVYHPEIPIQLEQIIIKCAEKKPERRFASAGDVIHALRKTLLQSESEFVKTDASAVVPPQEERTLNSETIPISEEELAQINDRKRLPVAGEAAAEKPEREIIPAKKKSKKKNPEDEVNSQIERLFAGAGIVVAIIIVVVMIVVFIKLSGMLKFGFSDKETETSTELAMAGAEDTSLSDTEVYMPDLYDMTEDMAEAQLDASDLNMKRTYQFSDDVESGHVISQTPKADEVVARWSSVTVVISNGTDKIVLAGLVTDDMDGKDAKSLLESKNLVVNVVEEESETVTAGKILRYEPERVLEGGTVTLYVSSGPHVNLVPIPALEGKPEEEAIALLAEAGLSPGNTSTAYSDTVERGHIISQSGGSDGMILAGDKIDYVVSSGALVKQQRYVASINNTYDLSNLIGPGAGSASVTILVRLHQVTNGKDDYKTLTDARTISGDVLLPISYTSIESMNGTDIGEIEVVDVTTGAVLKTYPLTFFPMD